MELKGQRAAGVVPVPMDKKVVNTVFLVSFPPPFSVCTRSGVSPPGNHRPNRHHPSSRPNPIQPPNTPKQNQQTQRHFTKQEVEVLLTEAKRDYTLLRYRLHATKAAPLGAMLNVGGACVRVLICVYMCVVCGSDERGLSSNPPTIPLHLLTPPPTRQGATPSCTRMARRPTPRCTTRRTR